VSDQDADAEIGRLRRERNEANRKRVAIKGHIDRCAVAFRELASRLVLIDDSFEEIDRSIFSLQDTGTTCDLKQIEEMLVEFRSLSKRVGKINEELKRAGDE
jgi:chromosome segregation ATPase